MGSLFVKLGLTRDSALWLWTKLVGLAGLVMTGVIDPAQLGLSAKQQHVVMIVCGAIAYLAGQMSTSSLPGKPSSDTVSQSTLDKIARSIPAVFLALVIAGATLSGCGHPPAGYTAQGQKAAVAVQVLRGLDAVSQTSRNLNAQKGTSHLSDRDTLVIRDGVLVIAAAVRSYGTDASSLQIARDAYAALMQHLSVDAKAHPQLALVLGAVGVALNQIQ